MKNCNNYFPGSNTCRGFKSLYPYISKDCKHTFILKGGPGTGKSSFLKKLAKKMLAKNQFVEYHWCSSDPASLDAVVFPDLKLAFIDGNPPHTVEPTYPGAIEEIINLGAFWDGNFLRAKKNSIIKLSDKIKVKFDLAYMFLAQGHLLYAAKAKNYSRALQEKPLLKKLKDLFIDLPIDFEEDFWHRRLFGTAITPWGPKNFLSSLTEEYRYRLIFDGPPGTKITTVLHNLHQLRLPRSHCLFLHCGFDKDGVDGLLFPSKSIAILDGTPPHVIESKPGDILINTYDYLNTGKLLYSNFESAELDKQFNYCLEKAVEILAQAKSLREDLEEIFIQAMDFSLVNKELEKTLIWIDKWQNELF